MTRQARDFVILFQDEGRFGRISDVRACWAPGGVRPKVPRQVVRQSLYAYAAVAPMEGSMVSRLAPKCNTEQFGHFLEDVAHAYAGRQIIMFLDGAGWHKAKALNIPPHMRLEFLPPYTPECNPVEHVWDEVREKGFANRLFATLDDVEARLKTELALLAESPERLGQLTCFTWIRGLLLYI